MLRAIEEMYGVTPGETTEDGELSVMTARCIGSCGLAPAAVLDGDVIGRVATDELVDKIEGAIGNDA
jgi:bidirectional [NiFe] hydrogenase diaphorase subunit